MGVPGQDGLPLVLSRGREPVSIHTPHVPECRARPVWGCSAPSCVPGFA